MCRTCGCGSDATTVRRLAADTEGVAQAREEIHSHDPDQGHRQSHRHLHDHSHPASDDDHSTLDLEARVLAKNDALAMKNRAWFAAREILALNLASSPGSGKTTILERTIAELNSVFPLYVIEGDQATTCDGERIRAAGAAVVQVNTGSGCHLDALMTANSVAALNPEFGSIVLIENVGNLVCPALFDLGEHAKCLIFSVTEGEDKLLKYPRMFMASDLVIINKIDLALHVDFNREQALANIRSVNQDTEVIFLSARSGEGLDMWCNWLRHQMKIIRGGNSIAGERVYLKQHEEIYRSELSANIVRARFWNEMHACCRRGGIRRPIA
ncbi:hydrogenase accessory protein HypB [Methylocystis sp. MitZ-2018]|nr:hydrogenase accessory protein HypB [Methylocystis sp. MitZ-2018]